MPFMYNNLIGNQIIRETIRNIYIKFRVVKNVKYFVNASVDCTKYVTNLK